MKTPTKTAARRTVKILRAELGALRLAQMSSGYEATRFDRIKAIDNEIDAIERAAGLLGPVNPVDSLVR